MRRFEAWALALWTGLSFAADEAPAWRWSAPVVVEQAAPFVQLALPPSAWARATLPELADLRLVDARGERVPFALLEPRAPAARSVDRERDATLYPLPPRPTGSEPWPNPVEIDVQGDRIRVLRGAGRTTAPAGSPGWLLDLGEAERDAPLPRALRLAWSGPAEFTATFDLETSAELRTWHRAGSGQVMALASPGGALVQAEVPLPADAARFVRLVWREPAAAPALTGARVLTAEARSDTVDPPAEWPLKASAATAGGLVFDLGGVLPVQAVDLRLPPGTRVVPLRVEGRNTEAEAWRELGATVFYQLERDGRLSHPPPLPLQARVRWLRLVVDPRGGTLDPATTQLVVQAALPRLVFAAQGTPPFTLKAGVLDSKGITTGALPVATLVPQLEQERPRFGRARLGDWAEAEAVARAAAEAERRAARRPWLLWAVLLAGVGGLAFVVWRLLQPHTPKPGT